MLAPHNAAFLPDRTNIMAAFSVVSSSRCFGGEVLKYKHTSALLGCDMHFSVFVPPRPAPADKAPVLFFLAGLTCNEDNFITKAGALRTASRLGLALVCPDTSPRGLAIPGDSESWDFGVGAGFYVDATQPKWARYQMHSYITRELPALLGTAVPSLDMTRCAISGHSMGGHGALTIAMRNPGMFKSASAFAPISNPINCPWGIKAFTGYLGADDAAAWKQYDATELAKSYSGPQLDILVDQGSVDKFLVERQLLPENLVDSASGNSSISLSLRMQEGYDHSYWFISSFIDDHLEFHAKHLQLK
eukprot:jgi/Hompol1/3189/HPOL_006394-RA